MPRPFRRLTLVEFADLLARFPFTRRINAVHMHHTWKPRHGDYSGLGTIEGMWRYHTVNLGWTDIAQHITIAPDGSIWTGRGWNEPPASAGGHNGNRTAGPFMFEMIGDFDSGRDPFRSPQRDAVLEVIARVQMRFGLPVESLRFHNQMSPKTCPGNSLRYTEMLAAVRTVREGLEQRELAGGRNASESPFPAAARTYRKKTDSAIELLTGASAHTDDPADAEHPDASLLESETRAMTHGETRTDDDWERIAATSRPTGDSRANGDANAPGSDPWHRIATTGKSKTSSGASSKSSVKAKPTSSKAGKDSRRRALCVGIDTYPTAPLYGCVADARTWAEELKRLGFEVSLMVNEEATREAILEAMNGIVRSSTAGDVVVVQYAGHGTTVKDISGDDTGGNNKDDEALCPYDFATGALIIDDDVAEIFRQIPEGVNLTGFFDCCHSGTISRFGIGIAPENETRGASARPRFVQATPALEAAHAAYRQTRGTRHASGNRGPDSMRQVIFAACLDSEVAWESDGHGDFTRVAARLLRDAAQGMTNEEFARRVIHEFGATPRQHPELDCAPPSRSRGFLQPLTQGVAKTSFVGAQSVHVASVGHAGNGGGTVDLDVVADTLRSLATRLQTRK